MRKSFWLLVLCGLFFPLLGFADGNGDTGSITFAPSIGDYSVIFLSNIFGVVDGVLHGTGSQIMGSLFTVFNSAVMAIGGMVVTYTMVISTMNTAHEGEMLGKKWNSIWVPVRATTGFALLIPKASGYCILQIFVMWIVVQGVGAADKLWDAALSYLNRGGVVIQAQADPTQALFGKSGSQEATQGAMVILAGQVCMYALQQSLNNLLTLYHKSNQTVCPAPEATTGVIPVNFNSTNLNIFCSSNTVPDFLSTVDIVKANDAAAANGGMASVTMPNFPAGNPADSTDVNNFYHALNGVCGTLSWQPIVMGAMATTPQTTGLNGVNLSVSESKSLYESRGIAIQQMYSDLSAVAQVMVNNYNVYAPSASTSSASSSSTSSSATPPAPPGPIQSWGVPLTSTGTECTSMANSECTSWGLPSGGGALLTGTELQGAVLDYIGVMQPTLSLIAQVSGTNSNVALARAFIQKASDSGWIMAGAYFFQLILLSNQNENAVTNTPGGLVDSSGLDASTFANGVPTQPSNCEPSASSATATPTWTTALCDLYNNSTYTIGSSSLPQNVQLSNIGALLGTTVTPKSIVTSVALSQLNVQDQGAESTVYGYWNNASMVTLPGQPGQQKLQFANQIQMHFSNTRLTLPQGNFPCGGVHLLFIDLCLGQILGNIIYNHIVYYIMNFFVGVLLQMIDQVAMSVMTLPLAGFAAIFKTGIRILSDNSQGQSINPIVALANMGTYYINFVGKLAMLQIMQVAGLILSIVGIPLVAFVVMAMPIVVAWAVIMLGIGFITAYYIPAIPYMMFTFGAFAWFMVVIEAIVAAPIVALGLVHPEGHDTFGKAEAAIMILMNVFLRPSMMIIGYIAAISLTYVGVWMLNAGFDTAIGFMQGGASFGTGQEAQGSTGGQAGAVAGAAAAQVLAGGTAVGTAAAVVAGVVGFAGEMAEAIKQGVPSHVPGVGDVQGGYTEWAGVFAYFFSVLIYTYIYMTLVEKAFTLITTLPDQVLRWIGGQAERSEAAQWAEGAKSKVQESGGKAGDAMSQTSKIGVGKIAEGLSPPTQGGMSASGGAGPAGGAGGAAGGAGGAGGAAAAGGAVVA